MARVTVEDCIDKVENQFDLVVAAGHRARQLLAGMPAHLEKGDDKDPVVALREIAEEKVSPKELMEGVVQSYRSHRVMDAKEDNFDHLLEADEKKSVEIGSEEGAPTDASSGSDQGGVLIGGALEADLGPSSSTD